ncbi:hypothetical protein [Pseudonocardia alni]|uniref:hypothetical protein n=1 Tax=Pseudonocardia alni TaxID=33907 RepID=UPI00331AF40D
MSDPSLPDKLRDAWRSGAVPLREVGAGEFDFAADLLEGLARALRAGTAEGAVVMKLITDDGSTIHTWSVQLPPTTVRDLS